MNHAPGRRLPSSVGHCADHWPWTARRGDGRREASHCADHIAWELRPIKCGVRRWSAPSHTSSRCCGCGHFNACGGWWCRE